MGFTVVAVAMPYDPPTSVQRIMRDLQFNFPVALDLTHEASAAFGGVNVIPTSFLIAPDGRIASRIVDRVDRERLRRQISAWVGS
jgi:peroxiredoxin